MLNKSIYLPFVNRFQAQDRDPQDKVRPIPNQAVADWMERQIPLFDCPDALLKEIYYFRWWTYRKHIKRSPEGYVITEFLQDVPWTGPYNTISGALGHHFDEGRWIADRRILSDYARFWLTGSGKGNRALAYNHWLCTAIYRFCLHVGDFSLAIELLDPMIEYFEKRRQSESGGLYWSTDASDGMEYSISGNGIRPTLNSYLCSDALALSHIASYAGRQALAESYLTLHKQIKAEIQSKLWSRNQKFYITRSAGSPEAAVRKRATPIKELIGYFPWYFGAAGRQAGIAWKLLYDPAHFFAPFGPTTADQSDRRFMKTEIDHERLWDGPSWPYATSVVLGGLAAYLRSPGSKTSSNGIISKREYYQLLYCYAASHFLTENGENICWIDENLHPKTGDWLARSLIQANNPIASERGMAYNHSTFCNLILSDLIGILPTEDGHLLFQPLTPDDWDYFAVDHLSLFGQKIGIYWDRNGDKYEYGKGLTITIGKKAAFHSQALRPLKIKIRKDKR